MRIRKIKVSELPLAQTLRELSTIGVDAANKSCKVSLEFVQDSAENADRAAASADRAAGAANEATDNAVVATNDAKAAASDARDATTKANQATQDANTAASSANQAASAANQATQDTIAATNDAESATAQAQQATSTAHQAAQHADTATAAADRARSAAEKATGEAVTAANDANTASSQAKEATNNATRAANTANDAAQLADAARIRVENAIIPIQTQVNQNTSDIENLKGVGRISVRLGNSPTPQQLTQTWTSVKGGSPITGSTIVNLDQDYPAGHAWTYFEVSSGVYTWVDRGTDTVGQATNASLGTVKGSSDTGKVKIETDGTMSVNGAGSGDVTGAKVGGNEVPKEKGVLQFPAYPNALPTPHSLTFTGGVTGNWNGSASKTVVIPTTLPASDVSAWAKAAAKPAYTPSEVGAAAAVHAHTQISGVDERNVDPAPFDKYKYGLSGGGLKANNIDGLNDGGTYHNSIHLVPWTDASGGTAFNLAFTDNENMWLRAGRTAWSKWKKIYHSANSNLVTVDWTAKIITAADRVNSANGFFQTSDERLKNFHEDLRVDWDALKALPKKYYRLKSDQTGQRHIGTSAQALLEIYPEIVGTDTEGNFQVDYAKLSVVALAAVSELEDRVQPLERRLALLEAQLSK